VQSVPNPDPPIESPTGRLVNDQLEYMVATYVRPSPLFQRGKGCYLWDTEGRRYLDLTAGIAVNGLGHCDEEVAQILHDQVCSLIRTGSHTILT
jgi:acetylornithine aminotransferase